MKSRNKTICMIVQNPTVKGGIAAVINGYRGSELEKDFNIVYVESYKNGGKIAKLLKAICGYIHFIKVLLVDKPELIHIHSSFGPSFYRKIPYIFMASWAKKPIVNHIHGAEFEPFYLSASTKRKKLVRKIYNKCSTLIALSDEWKERLKTIVPEEKVVIIENYSIVNDSALAQRLNRVSNNTVLFLGEIGKRKGCYDIPDVVEQVVKEVPNVKFVLCGDGEVNQIKELLCKKGINNNVIFPGWVRGKSKDKILKDSDIFFLPSYNEGMPMSVLDAMGYGLPIVSTNVGGIPKIVHEGQNGYVCEAGDVKDFANRIILLLKSELLQKRFGEKSIEIIKKSYSLDMHIKLIGKLYKDALKAQKEKYED